MGEFGRIEVFDHPSNGRTVTVVRVRDSKLSGPTLMQELAHELTALIEQDQRTTIVLNLSRVDFISSAALNRLINFQKRVVDAGGKLKMCCLTPQVESVFVATRLIQVFDIRPTEADALSSF
jgi:anti-sigma B factor antagonist